MLEDYSMRSSTKLLYFLDDDPPPKVETAAHDGDRGGGPSNGFHCGGTNSETTTKTGLSAIALRFPILTVHVGLEALR